VIVAEIPAIKPKTDAACMSKVLIYRARGDPVLERFEQRPDYIGMAARSLFTSLNVKHQHHNGSDRLVVRHGQQCAVDERLHSKILFQRPLRIADRSRAKDFQQRVKPLKKTAWSISFPT
jgi:hypothetical protein